MKHDLKERQEKATKLKHKDVALVRAELLAKQHGKCALCGIKLTTAKGRLNQCLDHCHSTGFIRAVLCKNCNRAEGKIKTSANMAKRGGSHVMWLQRLAAYWILHETPQHNLIHPTHKTEEEKRVRRNEQARKRRLEKKDG